MRLFAFALALLSLTFLNSCKNHRGLGESLHYLNLEKNSNYTPPPDLFYVNARADGLTLGLIKKNPTGGELFGVGILTYGDVVINKTYEIQSSPKAPGVGGWSNTANDQKPLTGTVLFETLPADLEQSEGQTVSVKFDLKTWDGKILNGQAISAVGKL